MLSHRIYRRPFNPSLPQAKDIRTVVAMFSHTAKAEAEACLKFLQDQSTSFKDDNNQFAKYRYTMFSDPAPVKEKVAALQLDTTAARSTKRPIAYELTWDVKHDSCKIMAYHRQYGTIRAEIEDTVEARQFFVRAIKRVWPNAELSKK